jgi:hypothetical protein
MLAPVDVTRLSLLPTVSGRGDTIPGGAPSFSLRGNDDPKDGHSFFWREPPSLLSPSPHFSLLLSSRLSPSSSSLLQAGGDGEKTLCELGLLDAAAVATRADAILGEDTGAARRLP